MGLGSSSYATMSAGAPYSRPPKPSQDRAVEAAMGTIDSMPT
jgi:hypothetical protein